MKKCVTFFSISLLYKWLLYGLCLFHIFILIYIQVLRELGPKSKPKYNLHLNIYDAAKNGSAKLLDILISKKDSKPEYLHDPIMHENEIMTTPLIIAASRNHYAVVKLLLGKYRVDVEQTGLAAFPNYGIIDGVTALWCAVTVGNLEMVKMLVEDFNADINKKLTPPGSVEDIRCKYAVSPGGYAKATKKYNSSTYLMIASENGHKEVKTVTLISI